MKKLSVFFAAVIVMILAANEVNAQPPWAKAYGKRNREWKEDRRENRWEHEHENHGKHWKHERRNFYYYPSANVYYNPVAHNYWYPRNGVWVSVDVLPRNIVVVNQPRYDVYYDGDDDNVWRDNRSHCEVYRAPQRVVVVNPPRPGVNVDIRARF